MGAYKYTWVPKVSRMTSEGGSHGMAAADVVGMNFINEPGVWYQVPSFLIYSALQYVAGDSASVTFGATPIPLGSWVSRGWEPGVLAGPWLFAHFPSASCWSSALGSTLDSEALFWKLPNAPASRCSLLESRVPGGPSFLPPNPRFAWSRGKRLFPPRSTSSTSPVQSISLLPPPRPVGPLHKISVGWRVRGPLLATINASVNLVSKHTPQSPSLLTWPEGQCESVTRSDSHEG